MPPVGQHTRRRGPQFTTFCVAGGESRAYPAIRRHLLQARCATIEDHVVWRPCTSRRTPRRGAQSPRGASGKVDAHQCGQRGWAREHERPAIGRPEKGVPTPSVPLSRRASEESIGRSQIWVRPSLPTAENARVRPSGDRAKELPSVVFSGHKISKRVTSAGGGFSLKCKTPIAPATTAQIPATTHARTSRLCSPGGAEAGSTCSGSAPASSISIRTSPAVCRRRFRSFRRHRRNTRRSRLCIFREMVPIRLRFQNGRENIRHSFARETSSVPVSISYSTPPKANMSLALIPC